METIEKQGALKLLDSLRASVSWNESTICKASACLQLGEALRPPCRHSALGEGTKEGPTCNIARDKSASRNQ